MLYNNILETIGKTPLVRLNKISAHLNCSVYVKCEFFNPGGSVKDRIAYNMICKAEKEGLIQKGDTLIEPTSGNTGVGIALAGAVLGYKTIIIMPEKMSQEKEVTLRALGAEIRRTPTDVAWDHKDSHISLARRLVKELPRAFILDQYANPHNVSAHYEGTAVEILNDLNQQVDMIVAGAGTGGTLTGLSRKIKEVCPACEIIGVDPLGSILAGEGPVHPYEVEGIGYDFIPEVLDRSRVTEWVKTTDKEAFYNVKKLIREEGILAGGSSGSVITALLKTAPRLKKGQTCVAILPDGIRNYMSKFLNNEWMKEKQFN
ncbi:MAG: pyridoxal-phosphate dependent enzyme [Oligoflexia bacterium]|nr:pyridoxal-phosphate dependent enzyme [Oligoflexia bacterium]